MTSTRPSDVGRYARTLAHLPPGQVAHRIRLRGKRAAYARTRIDLERRWASTLPASGGWPEGFEPTDAFAGHRPPDIPAAGSARIDAVGESLDVLADGWRAPQHSQLFRYHLHYFDWAWGLAADPTEGRPAFAVLWASWRRDTVAGRWDEWSPYVVSLRAWNLCGVFDALVRGSDVEADVLLHLRACLGFLRSNLELDVHGNHLVKNLKAVIGLGVFFGVDTGEESALLADEMDRQVLDDGGHYELSPSYHVQVMADLLDLSDLSDTSMRSDSTWLRETVARMGTWLAAVSYPDGSLPLIGDCAPPAPGLLGRLRERAPGLAPRAVEVLESSGVVVVRPLPGTMLVLDMGRPCPPELPAHAQADWGTFELFADGRRVVVDPGVSTYVGERRAWERSTAAHNTVAVGGGDSTEVWGSFRAGRLGTAEFAVTGMPDGSVEVVGRQFGYRHLRGSPVHVRRVSVRGGVVRVSDEVSAASPVTAASSITLADGVDPGWVRTSSPVAVRPLEVAAGFGRLAPALGVTQTLDEYETVWWEFDLSRVRWVDV